MKVAVVGAGPAGSYCAYRLTRDGHETVLIDPLGPHEKICGGGVPQRCIAHFPHIYASFPPAQRLVYDFELSIAGAHCCTVPVPGGMGIFSRRDHDTHLFNMALEEGAVWIRERCRSIERKAKKWVVTTDENAHTVDFLVGADGASSRIRHVLIGRFPGKAFFKASDYLVKDSSLQAHIAFHPKLNGYLWVFPRDNEASVGVADYGNCRAEREAILRAFLAQLKVSQDSINLHRSAVIPALGPSQFRDLNIGGKGWALIGDAAGLAEPLTGEGIYYAMRSAECLADCNCRGEEYNLAWKGAFGRPLLEASRRRGVYYRALRSRPSYYSLRRSAAVRRILGEALAAHVPYSSIKWEVVRNGGTILREIATG